MTKSVDALIEEVSKPRGCKASLITDPKAREFVARVTLLKRQGEDPNIERAAEILRENWNEDISGNILSKHARGKCSCPKK